MVQRDTGMFNNETKGQTLAEHQEKHTESINKINLAVGQIPTTVAAVLLPRLILNTPVDIIPIWAWLEKVSVTLIFWTGHLFFSPDFPWKIF